MKYCQKCGKEMLDEAVMCPHCKNMVSGYKSPEQQRIENNNSPGKIIAAIAIVLGAVVLFAIILYCMTSNV